MSEYIKYQKSKMLYGKERTLYLMKRMLVRFKMYYRLMDRDWIQRYRDRKHFILHLGLSASACLWKLLKTNNEKTSDSNLIFRSPSVVLARSWSPSESASGKNSDLGSQIETENIKKEFISVSRNHSTFPLS